jgi:hypothetical protein
LYIYTKRFDIKKTHAQEKKRKEKRKKKLCMNDENLEGEEGLHVSIGTG